MSQIEITELSTEHLILRQWRDNDLPPFAKLNADLGVMEYYPNTLNLEESNEMARKLKSLLANRGWGFWAVEEKKSNQFIGFVGLHQPTYDLPVTGCTEIGWRLAKSYWGLGYATEAAKMALNYAFTTLNEKEIFSFTPTGNHRSRSVMERIGMQNTKNNFEHPIIPKGHKLRDHVLYKINKEQWVEQCSI